jgi:hypothetical protein
MKKTPDMSKADELRTRIEELEDDQRCEWDDDRACEIANLKLELKELEEQRERTAKGV